MRERWPVGGQVWPKNSMHACQGPREQSGGARRADSALNPSGPILRKGGRACGHSHPYKYLYSETFHSRPERRDLAMAAKKAKGDDWFSSLDAELEKKTREIIENVGEQNVARLELNKTLIEDFWRVWKRFNKINVHFALEPSYTNWGVFPDTFPDGDWHWRPGFNTAAVQSIQLLDRSMDQGRVGDALKVNYVETDGKAHLRVTFEYCEGEHYYKYSGWKRIWTIHTLYDQPLEKTNVDDLHRLFADLVRVWYESHLRRNRDVLIKYLKQTFEKVETFNQ